MRTRSAARRKLPASGIGLLPAIVAVCIAAQALHAAVQPNYSYFFRGELITLSASETLVAIKEQGTTYRAFATDNNLVRDAVSARGALATRGVALYRRSGPPKDAAKPPAKTGLAAALQTYAAKADTVVQPVFEQGAVLMIPWDEVTVGFPKGTSLAQATARLAPHRQAHGITGVRQARPNTFIATIDNPSMGRVYAVSRQLAQAKGIAYAEPNPVIVHNYGPAKLPEVPSQPADHGRPPPPRTSLKPIPQRKTDALIAVRPAWAADATDFESGMPAGWAANAYNGYTSAYWGFTTHRKHSGSQSLYCAQGGTAAATAPGPAPNGMKAYIETGGYDLTGYEEVYVQAWFYTVNERYYDGGTDFRAYDYPRLVVNDYVGNKLQQQIALLMVPYTDDCTQDPTTAGGWRRALWRIHPNYRTTNVSFEFQFISDGDVQVEGCYIDDVAVMATTDVDTNPIGINDPYSARQYEFKNAGQIVNLGTDANDLEVPEAWALTGVDPNLIVAVIDSGVDPHSDINKLTGYAANGTVANYDTGAHGTSVAGNIGAIANNSLGVSGTAPNVKIQPIINGNTATDIAAAVDLAVTRGAKVLNNSWGWVGAPVQAIVDAVQDALTAGRVVLFAAGNGPDRSPWTYDVAFPGNMTGYSDVICVGASSPTDEHKNASSSDGLHSWGSSYVGAGPDVCAPGPWSYTTDVPAAKGYNDGTTESPVHADYTLSFGGTSSSTPKVAGIVALMLSANANLSPAQVKSILRSTAVDIDAAGVDDRTGWGRVNAHAAVQAAQGTTAFQITASAGANGSISPAGTFGAVAGTNVPFTASPATGYEVDVWKLDTATVQTGGFTYTLSNIQANHAVEVTFKVASQGNYHPADADQDWYLRINEVTAYGAAWQRGDTWPVAPNPIPESYVNRASFLWKAGERYLYDQNVGAGAPYFWVSAP
jgi:subtilisin family serine protease